MIDPVVERFLRLGLRLDRHVEGTVDAYFGPPEFADEAKAEPPVDPRTLVADAEALLADVEDGWLRDQIVGLRTYAGVLAGEALTYSDEVAGCYGIRPPYTDESVFQAALRRLDDLLPGEGPFADRHDRWRKSFLIPEDRVEATMTAVIEEARRQTQALVDLPDGEGVVVETVRDVAWMGFNFYLGGLRGRVAINLDLPVSGFDLLRLAIHETYPGHQAERAAKEQSLVRDGGRLEESIVLVPTPQSVIAEGIGCLAPRYLLSGDGAEALAALVSEAGAPFDLALAMAIEEASEPCRWVEVNAATMLHEQKASEDDVRAYLCRWGGLTEEIAGHLIRFMNEPTSRTYVMNYPAGFALCSRYVAGDAERFRKLLSSQIRVGELIAALDGAPLGPLPPSS
jgi:hypothetical protein